MRLIISALAGALLAACSACTIVPPQKPPELAPSAPVAVEPAPSAPAPKAKTKKARKALKEEAKKKKQQIRSVVSKGAAPDCGLVRWAAETFDAEKIKRLERSASAEQKKHAKACLEKG